eukprot:CAMPEP_0202878676 /NCGR_PEP_ID=MMETSP1391-20130828/32562_1 /ASSEMBLY_ACC=CAM_ASM_000867 /TAXON_ID=1034604 /ORGANISM="Chlamydomonas leiostraca, Strain SAG 11-49" /LENGTH=176 /DNA_ID=CAMNT_0049560905 /DNA_START=105 /DNA_END=631 /DNA_ORIENTATION=+
MQDYSEQNELLLMRYGSPGQSPGAMMMDTEGSSMSYEEEVAGIMGQLLMERIDAKQAVQALEGMCIRRADELRKQVAQHVHRPARFMHLQALAAEMEGQAATWHLVWCLHCTETPQAGTGGPDVLDAGGKRTARHIAADRVSSDPALLRCAAVVAWLESMADDALGGGEGAEGSGP